MDHRSPILNINVTMDYYNLDGDEADIAYQDQYLNVFDINEYDSETIKTKTDLLYAELKGLTEIKDCIYELIEKVNNDLSLYLLIANSDDDMIKNEVAFSMLFSFENFYIFNKCYQKYINSEKEAFKELLYHLKK